MYLERAKAACSRLSKQREGRACLKSGPAGGRPEAGPMLSPENNNIKMTN